MRTVGFRHGSKDWLFHFKERRLAQRLANWCKSLDLPHFHVPSDPGTKPNVIEYWEVFVQIGLPIPRILELMT